VEWALLLVMRVFTVHQREGLPFISQAEVYVLDKVSSFDQDSSQVDSLWV